MGGADGVSGSAHARDSSLHFVPLRMTKYCTCGTHFFVILRRILSSVILRSTATKDLALARSSDGANTQGWRAEVVEPEETARRVVAPYETAASLPPVRAKRASPFRGGSHAPSYCNSKWVEAVWRDNAFTRAARPEGKRGDSQEGRNRRCSPSCAPAARSGYVPAARRRRNPLPVGNGHKRPPFKANTAPPSSAAPAARPASDTASPPARSRTARPRAAGPHTAR